MKNTIGSVGRDWFAFCRNVPSVQAVLDDLNQKGVHPGALTQLLIEDSMEMESLDGIEEFTSLTKLSFTCTKISDLRPLFPLKGLKELNFLYNTLISDLTGIPGNLTKLTLSVSPEVTTIAPLPASLAYSLEQLSLLDLDIRDLAHFDEFHKEDVMITIVNCPMDDFVPPVFRKHARVTIQRVKKHIPIPSQPGYEWSRDGDGRMTVHRKKPELKEVGWVDGKPSIKVAHISSIGEIVPLMLKVGPRIGQVKELDIVDSYALTSLAGIEKFESLSSLLLCRTRVSDLSPLADHKGLMRVDLIENPLIREPEGKPEGEAAAPE